MSSKGPRNLSKLNSESASESADDTSPLGADSENTSDVGRSGGKSGSADTSLDRVASSSGAGSELEHSFLIVGIGASAGGLEAFQAFFRNLNESSGMAFVLISHLSPDHESLLSELLSKETQMRVQQVRESTLVEPNQVYVIPPSADLTIQDGVLQLTKPVQARGHRSPIDVFFRSLARDQGENAVCVVLSGTGSDGTIGLKSIKEFGGLAIAQDSDSAKYASMPRSAALTGLVDYVLPVEQIPATLVEYASHRQGLRERLGEDGMFAATADHLSQICGLLRRRVGHDFSGYKQNTLIRRIQRRIQITQIGSVAAYVRHLKADSNEINLLFSDLLIGVTHFFRDPDSFEALRHEVIAPLVASKDANDVIRVWVPGCSSGEEAYSIAMLLSEEIDRQDSHVQVQIFATDIDSRALDTARQACYPESVSDQITPERMENFFIKHNGVYQVVKSLRGMCVFSQHSLISDPPFSRLDLISCRNLLIYFDTELQRKLIPLFHYALYPESYLFLGSSEALSGHSELFRTINKPHRVFQSKRAMISPQVDFPLIERSEYRQSAPRLEPQLRQTRQQQVSRSIERVLLQEYSPPCVIINEENDVIYFFGRTGKYLEPSQGLPSNNLFDLTRLGLRLDLRAAIQSARETQQPAIRERVSVQTEERVQTLNLIVRPVKDADANEDDSGLLMVIFQDVLDTSGYSQGSSSLSEPSGESQVVDHLEGELRKTKEHLRATIEELETSNEELKSANEELLSMNEELQSSNEELQTSKEEMQSINEELETVNSELRSKIDELDSVNSDLQNLFESTQIATVFLDRSLRIKKFTPAVNSIFSFLETDVGRPITDMALTLDDIDIVADVRQVLLTLIPVRREVRLENQEIFYNMRILPYRTMDNVIDGVVLTFVDVTSLRQAQQEAENAARRQQSIAELGIYALQHSDMQMICDRAIEIICSVIDSSLCSLFVYDEKSAELLLKSFSGSDLDSDDKSVDADIDGSLPGYALSTGGPIVVDNFAQEIRFTPSELVRQSGFTSGVAVPVYGAKRPYGVLTIYAEQSGRFSQADAAFLQAMANCFAAAVQNDRSSQALAKNRERLDLALKAGKMGVWELDIVSNLSTWNSQEYELLGLSPAEVDQPTNGLFLQFVHPEDRLRVQTELETAVEQGSGYESEFRIRRADGQLRWLVAQAKVILDSTDRPVKVIGINYDITDRKQTESMLREADRNKDEFLAILGHELRNPLNALNTSLQLLQRTKDPERLSNIYAVADRQLKHFVRLIDDLLDASRIAYGKIRLQRRLLNLKPLLQNLVNDARPSCQQKNIALELELPEPPVWIDGDADRLNQAFGNILSNAVKFSNPGGRVTVLVATNENKVCVTVKDEGIGLMPESLTRIFVAFRQETLSAKSKSGNQGLGLGLPLAKGLIELHDGSIRARSEGLEQGTEIMVELPLLNDLSDTPDGDAAAPGAAEPLRVESRPRVLIVEDNDDASLVLQYHLEDMGCQVEVVRDGEAALEIIRRFNPVVILSDIDLPGSLDGYDIARAVRADARLQGIYLVATSGYGQSADKAAAEEAGFDEHLTKPLDLAQVRQIVAERARL